MSGERGSFSLRMVELTSFIRYLVFISTITIVVVGKSRRSEEEPWKKTCLLTSNKRSPPTNVPPWSKWCQTQLQPVRPFIGWVKGN
ncbi:Uncharacterized protein HZ326_17939 [Fusarium oxysporum f. sp. albedinis]|nr:Uncharacterized protein HZ326_17939 [Fusarium oxysporum f. sp. albedinis]